MEAGGRAEVGLSHVADSAHRGSTQPKQRATNNAQLTRGSRVARFAEFLLNGALSYLAR